MASQVLYKGQDSDGAHIYETAGGRLVRSAVPPERAAYAQEGGQVGPPVDPAAFGQMLQTMESAEEREARMGADEVKAFLKSREGWQPPVYHGSPDEPAPSWMVDPRVHYGTQTPTMRDIGAVPAEDAWRKDFEKLFGKDEDIGALTPEMAPPPPAPVPTYTGMASIKGKLRALEKEARTASGDRATSLQAERDRYQVELERLEEESEVETAKGKMRDAEKAVGDATDKLSKWEINPTRAFPTVFSKLAAVISVAMGGYAQGLSGGKLPNTALQIITDAINRDIDAQKAEFQKLKGMVDVKRNMFGMAMKQLGDTRQAEEVARMAAYRTVGLNLDSMMKQYGLEDTVRGQIIQGLGLERADNQARANLQFQAKKYAHQVALKARAKGKLSKQAQAAIASSRGILEDMKGLGDIGREVGASFGPLTWVSGEVPFWETDAKRYNDASEQMILRVINATSGKTMTEFEHKKFAKWTPYAHDTLDNREAKMLSLLRNSSNNAVGWLAVESPQARATVLASNPTLAGIMDPALSHDQRMANVDKIMGEISESHEFKNAPAYGSEREHGK